MDQEYIRIQINNALDLLQIITEDVEGSFIKCEDIRIKARANMTVSALYVLSDFLRNICTNVTLTGVDALAARRAVQRARDISSEFEGLTDSEVLSRLVEAGLNRT